MSDERNNNNRRSSKNPDLARKRNTAKMRGRRRKKKRKIAMLRRVGIIALVIIAIVLGVFGTQAIIKYSKAKKLENQAKQEQLLKEEQQKATTQKETMVLVEQLVASYDYDGAIQLLNDKMDIDVTNEFPQMISEYETIKSNLVEADIEKIPHIFFNTLIADQEITWNLAGTEEYKVGDYNQGMTTIEEFKKIIQQMYDNGYVLVRMKDMIEEIVDEEGNTSFAKGKIMLPEGKKPFVMSQDDVSYRLDMQGDGFATKLVLDADGRLANEYQNADGTTLIGSYDLVPVLNDFLDEHPDFSYKGAKAVLAFTGYNGILGYRTDPELAKTEAEGNPYAAKYGVFNVEEEIANVKPIVEALRKEGWEFASNSYGKISYGEDFEKMKADADKWQERVASIIGPTKILLYPLGKDIGGWQPYSSDNEKYEYLKGQGFKFYCNVDSNPYWVQITSENVRQGRMNLDGYRMYQDLHNGADKLTQLFDVQSVFDETRPNAGLNGRPDGEPEQESTESNDAE